jgi:site-specific recombinase XerD
MRRSWPQDLTSSAADFEAVLARMQITEALDLFQLQLRANGRSAHTQNQYARHVRMLDAWLALSSRSRDLRDVDHVAVAEFLCSDAVVEKRGGGRRKATSANGLRSSLRSFFGWAHAAGYAHRNAAALVKRARCAPPPPRGLSEADQKRLLSELARATDPEGRRDHVLFATMLGTGVRVGSAVALDIEDVDLERAELRLRTAKNDRPAVVILPKVASAMLRDWIGGRTQGPLFPGRRGERITTRHVARRLTDWLRRAGVERRASPHSLRHSFAMRVYEKTSDVLLLQAAMAHASSASTCIYARVDQTRLRAVLGA